MAYQFAHTQTYSRKGNGNNRPVSGIVNEAVREPGYCDHVDSPKEASLLHGVSPTEIPQLIEQRIKQAKQLFPEQLKGKGKGIRKDQHVLEGAVFSHPSESADLADPEIKAQYERWRGDVLEWVKQDFGDRGLEFVSAVEHLDEAHPHIHAYGIPKATEANPRMDAKRCHAGHAARAAEPDRKLKNKAYKQAMRDWQDNHHGAVGERHGLLRFGPRRQRIDRKSYTIQKEAAKDLARKIEQSENMVDLSDQVNDLQNEKRDLEREVTGIRAKLKALYDTAKSEARKMIDDPITYIKEQFVKPLEEERDQLSSENSHLHSQLNALKNVPDERSRIVIENTLHELDMGIDRTTEKAPESDTGSHSNDFKRT